MKSCRHLLPFKSYFHFRFVSSPFCVPDVGDVTGDESGIIENIWVAAGIARRYLVPVKHYISSAGLAIALLNIGSRSTSSNVGSVIIKSDII